MNPDAIVRCGNLGQVVYLDVRTSYDVLLMNCLISLLAFLIK
ncbi:hypothetical protein SAMN05216419_101726 [Nitrosomonas cryotolerans]|uniref:Uncharacterized protein n=1 Tax=Nitrosomonas cryotolerans ATCC 49181 TaxID=1131553 RepID=A0A1N6FAW7_9PROT|nr:hypothetical protein SAMN05216419_101726 [Nitrosomonas cryotolerans]SIN92409.1 hypothetical protein SAMN02743940_0175 [Nitrosomonas cryotolerans ATCC 49181]